ncbi:hypothetical protein BHF72_1644 [Cloacibacterium normanense]|uniref:Uncharacterized protein n=1 Tax=Cloacibacterium normanense TaxID=237258 RepID=A0A1E5UG53_9FLAO|nr:hypothetical protein BHF72_1644 [Cloacibacterium normanense]
MHNITKPINQRLFGNIFESLALAKLFLWNSVKNNENFVK